MLQREFAGEISHDICRSEISHNICKSDISHDIYRSEISSNICWSEISSNICRSEFVIITGVNIRVSQKNTFFEFRCVG